MLSATLQQEIRRLEITTRHLVTEVFAGDYSSAFRGRGIEFSEVREYQPGDDVRSIDWNVTARNSRPPMDKAFVKRFDEERELTVVLAVDCSASGRFGSDRLSKQQVAVEAASLLSFAALKKNDRISLLLFTDRIEHFIPARKGSRHTLRLLRDLVAFEPGSTGTDIAAALDHLARVLRRRSVLFVVSDFLDARRPFDRSLRVMARRHDLIAVEIADAREQALPRAGLIDLVDAESGRRTTVDSSSPSVRRAYEQACLARRERNRKLFASSDVDHVVLNTGGSHARDLTRFFRQREQRR